jgi:hypothetical protein
MYNRSYWSAFQCLVWNSGSETREGHFSVLYSVQTGSGAHTAFYLMGAGGSLLEVKRLGNEADHLFASDAEVKNAWSYISPPIQLHGIILAVHITTLLDSRHN